MAAGKRFDIEGLRAVAVVAVLLYHAGFGPFDGGFIGVDVFFVVSGFLITGTLLREAEESGSVSLSGFYARRVRRLLPASALVLAVTALLVRFVLPVVRQRTYGIDIAAAAGYFVNWRFGFRSIDYLAEDIGASVVQHFWSLSVEEQFYAFWPLLVLAVAVVARREGETLRRLLGLALIPIVGVSLVRSIALTGSDPSFAFFDTTTRVWQLGVGGMVAVLAPQIGVIPRRVKSGLGVVGLGMILASVFTVGPEVGWPGWLALVPTLGTAGVIIAGVTDTTSVLVRLLGARLPVWLGGISYPLYLWHWPILLVGQHIGYKSSAAGLVLVTLSIIPAWATKRWVEDPIRFSPILVSSSAKSLLMGLGMTLVGLSMALVAGASQSDASSGLLPASLSGGTDGSYELVASVMDASALVPLPSRAPLDYPAAYDEGCQADRSTVEPSWCVFGDEDSSFRVVAIGDSKVTQWNAALENFGNAQGWRVEIVSKSGCWFSRAHQIKDGAFYPGCSEWNELVFAMLAADPPDVVITSHAASLGYMRPTDDVSDATSQAASDGLALLWQDLEAIGIEVIVLLDNPHPPNPPRYECVAEHPEDLTACDFDRQVGTSESAAPTQLTAAAVVPEVVVVDLSNLLCRPDVCPVVIGNILVYRQSHHVTETFVRAVSSLFEEAMLEAIGSGNP
jgi:peptidoglycan/LPS O-acetylase OafA/YrhL